MQMTYGRPHQSSSLVDLLQYIPNTAFEKTTRSTVPLLAWWRDQKHLEQLASCLGLPELPTADADFEYSVGASCARCENRGKGKSSFTDVMLDLGGDVLAIEAKHTEEVYETVGKWLGFPPTENKQKVLSHWIRCCVELSLNPETSNGLVYQMVHRTASACARAGAGGRDAIPRVVHLLFGSKHPESYVTAAKAVADYFRPRRSQHIRFAVVTIATTRVEANLAGLDGEPDALRERLADGSRPLFEFGHPELKWSDG